MASSVSRSRLLGRLAQEGGAWQGHVADPAWLFSIFLIHVSQGLLRQCFSGVLGTEASPASSACEGHLCFGCIQSPAEVIRLPLHLEGPETSVLSPWDPQLLGGFCLQTKQTGAEGRG